MISSLDSQHPTWRHHWRDLHPVRLATCADAVEEAAFLYTDHPRSNLLLRPMLADVTSGSQCVPQIHTSSTID